MPKPIDHLDLSIVTGPVTNSCTFYLEYRLEAETSLPPPINKAEVVKLTSSTYVTQRQNTAGPEGELDVRSHLSVDQARSITPGGATPNPPATSNPDASGTALVWHWPEPALDIQLSMGVSTNGSVGSVNVVQDTADPTRWNINVTDGAGNPKASGFILVKTMNT